MMLMVSVFVMNHTFSHCESLHRAVGIQMFIVATVKYVMCPIAIRMKTHIILFDFFLVQYVCLRIGFRSLTKKKRLNDEHRIGYTVAVSNACPMCVNLNFMDFRYSKTVSEGVGELVAGAFNRICQLKIVGWQMHGEQITLQDFANKEIYKIGKEL